MQTEFRFPDVGEGITEGTIVKWHVKVGDLVKEDDVLAEVETDKAVVEVPSPITGTILALRAKEGDTVNVGDVISVIGDAGEKVAAPAEPSDTEDASAPADTSDQEVTVPEHKKSVGVIGTLEEAPDDDDDAGVSTSQVKATPFVRGVAKELKVNIENIKGSGKGGRVTESDVRSAVKSDDTTKGDKEVVKSVEEKTTVAKSVPAKPAKKASKIKIVQKYDFYGEIAHIPFKGVRKVIAKNMIASKFSAPHVTHMDDADVTELYAIRKKEKEVAAKQDIKLTFLPFVIKACILAFEDNPNMNSMLDEENEEILVKKYTNMGFAIDTEVGLMVPVIKKAETLSILDIAKEIMRLSEAAKTRKINISEMKDSTFTVTNIGSIGGIYATPIINPPNVAILALGRIYDKAMVVGGEVVARKALPFSVAFDHRVLDGAYVARFANSLKKHLEDPDLILIKD